MAERATHGTQTIDGNWWFLDAAKQRVARFGADGAYLGQIIMPEDLLVDGAYFQYQLPQPLEDGPIVACGWRESATTSLLRINDGVATGVTFDGAVAWVSTDGTHLWARSRGQCSSPARSRRSGRRASRLVRCP